MKFINKLLLLSLVMLGMVACDNTELDLLDNPNAISPDRADVNDLYNSITLTFSNVLFAADGQAGAHARMYQLGADTYANASAPTNFTGMWFSAYSNLFPDVDALIPLAEERNLDIHAGSAKIMKAYTMMVLVDLMNDVPFSDAGKGAESVSPQKDAGQDVYNAALSLLDEAIAQLDGTTSPAPTGGDVMYDGNAANWVKAANSLKLRAAVTTRLIDPSGSAATINALVSGGNIITENSEDFQWNFGNQRNNPNSRHPFYNTHYELGDGAYLSTYYMWLLRVDKRLENGSSLVDPRIRYYFTRKIEDASAQDQTTYSCINSAFPDIEARPSHYEAIDPDMPYCIVLAGDGYIGRDHLNGSGIPPDGPIRTSFGLYPGGGSFDFDQYEDTRNAGTTGGLGQGLFPIMMASFVDFLRAEAALTIGTNDDPRALLESGIRKSMAKVRSFESLVPNEMSAVVTIRGEEFPVQETFAMKDEDIDEYVDFVLAAYDAANDDKKLDILMKEYYIALWGNGLEAYNMYRRTGKPDNMAPGIEPEVGEFTRSFFLPDVHVNRNANATQKALSDRVFWDDGSVELY